MAKPNNLLVLALRSGHLVEVADQTVEEAHAVEVALRPDALVRAVDAAHVFFLETRREEAIDVCR